ncbi:carboxypeptidase-like regulatory domain-containing protein [Tautonia marina]|uniref:carboxypeptidase-like regulatory domain-containing protein n=1 Tax=Tautonia marina TaxID=2653855 RepID=UPI00126106CD|nr:carboxypeptidase-like regulatory domain-containing protein [Tautonia marina]
MRLRILTALGAVAFLAGCSAEPSTTPTTFVPVSGTVTVDGEPLAGAVITFLQTDEKGTTANGETDEEGSYTLQAMMQRGIAPGRYQVGISYLMPPSGKPVGLSARSSLAPVADLAVAEELVPPRYSDLGQTELTVTVPEEGGTFDFDLEGPLLDPPAAEDSADPAEEAEAAAEAPEPESSESESSVEEPATDDASADGR